MGLFRLLLAFAVVEAHVVEQYDDPDNHGIGLLYGAEAVEIFFIISGFYMALILHEKYNRPGDYSQFLLQRFLRLYPVYLVVLVATIMLYLVVLAASGHAAGPLYFLIHYPQTQGVCSYAVYSVINLVVFGLESLCFFRQDATTGQLYFSMPPPGSLSLSCKAFAFTPQAWSLSLEFLFYLIAPFIVRKSVGFQAGLLAAGILLRYAFYFSPIWDVTSWLNHFFPSVLSFFLAGSLGYRFYRRYLEPRERLPAWVPWVLGIFGLLVLFYRRLPYAYTYGYDPVFIPVAAAVVPSLFALTRNIAWDRAIGELSYPVYLVHFQILQVLLPDLDKSRWLEPACFALTLLAAIILYTCLDRRVEIWRARLFQRSRKTAPGC
jgi:peptidoglycan/LPS O-acetylase OafA/YrhL